MKEVKRNIDFEKINQSKEKNIDLVMNKIKSYPTRKKGLLNLKYYFGVLAVLAIAFFTFYDLDNLGINSKYDNHSFLSIDINPSIEFLFDKEGTVVSVQYNNEDAEITSADLDYIGLHYNDAIDLFIEAAVFAGYVDVNTTDNNVVIIYSNENKELQESTQKEMQNTVQQYLEQNKIGAAVLTGQQVYDNLNDLALQYDISIGKVRMIQSIIKADPTRSITELAVLPVSELNETISDIHMKNMQQFKETRLDGSLELKARLIELNRNNLEAFHARVLDGSQPIPDYEAIRREHIDNYNSKSEEFNKKSDELINGTQNGNSSDEPQGGNSNSSNQDQGSGVDKSQKNGVFQTLSGKVQLHI